MKSRIINQKTLHLTGKPFLLFCFPGLLGQVKHANEAPFDGSAGFITDFPFYALNGLLESSQWFFQISPDSVRARREMSNRRPRELISWIQEIATIPYLTTYGSNLEIFPAESQEKDEGIERVKNRYLEF
jgi:hypothetical protein